MNGLQRAIEEARSVRLQNVYPPSSVGSVGIIGLAGLTTSSISGSGWELRFPPVPQAISRLSREVPSAVVGYRDRELEWRRTHVDALKAFANEWVVLEGETIVAHGRNPGEVVAQAKAQGIRIPYIFYVGPSGRENVVKMGL